MARPLRIEFPGALYHVNARGNARSEIFLGDGDRRLFLSILADLVERYNWICHGYCLMGKHFQPLDRAIVAMVGANEICSKPGFPYRTESFKVADR